MKIIQQILLQQKSILDLLWAKSYEQWTWWTKRTEWPLENCHYMINTKKYIHMHDLHLETETEQPISYSKPLHEDSAHSDRRQSLRNHLSLFIDKNTIKKHIVPLLHFA